MAYVVDFDRLTFERLTLWEMVHRYGEQFTGSKGIKPIYQIEPRKSDLFVIFNAKTKEEILNFTFKSQAEDYLFNMIVDDYNKSVSTDDFDQCVGVWLFRTKKDLINCLIDQIVGFHNLGEHLTVRELKRFIMEVNNEQSKF